MSEAAPTLSVLVPAYNAAATIGQALESALAQDPPPLEVIVSDDGSEDELDAAIAPFRHRVTVVRGPNAGLATARNRAAAAARGTFLALLDADDVWLPGRAAGIVDLARRRPDLDIITTDAYVVRGGVREATTYYEERGWPEGDQAVAILRSNFIFGAAAIRRTAFERQGGYDAGMRHAEDWDLWLRMILGGSRAGFVDAPLYEYRRRGDSLTHQRVDLALGVLAALGRVPVESLTDQQRRALRATTAAWRVHAANAATAARDRRRVGLAARAAISRGVGSVERVKVAARPIRASAWTLTERLDPARLALRTDPARSSIAVACVYRGRNADVVRALLAPLPATATVRLWSLDTVPPDLAGATAGCGPGTRFTLLNRLVASIASDARADALVLTDDDVEFVVGDLGRLAATGLRLGLDVFQPAHSMTSFASESMQSLVRKERRTVARVTGLVEQGPVLVMSRTAQDALVPLPSEMGMGWGVEVRWARQARAAGLSQGIVDAASIHHRSPPAGGYDTSAELARLDAELRAAGVADLAALQTVERRIGVRAGLSAWRRRPR